MVLVELVFEYGIEYYHRYCYLCVFINKMYGTSMPVVYKCSKCGTTLYAFMRAGQDYYGLPSPSELSVRVGSNCPKCGKTIDRDIDIDRIVIKVLK